MTYIGIDNGITGGIVALGPCAGTAPIYAEPMPLCKAPDGTKQIDAVALYKLLDNNNEVTVCVEECPHHAHRASTMRSMAMSYGMILGVLARFERSRGWTVASVKSGNALAGWQRQMLGNVPKGKTKEWALEAARSIWPNETWILPQCRVPHTGLIDAALIAEFGRRKGERRAL